MPCMPGLLILLLGVIVVGLLSKSTMKILVATKAVQKHAIPPPLFDHTCIIAHVQTPPKNKQQFSKNNHATLTKLHKEQPSTLNRLETGEVY